MGRFFWGSVAFLAVGLILSGCGTPSGVPGLEPVTGTVTLDGQPVDGATISFAPTATDGRAGFATTGADGTFTLNAVGGGQGALPGKYQVAVTKIQSGPQTGSSSAADYAAQMSQRMQSGAPLSVPPSPPKHLLPEKYSMPTTSQLEVEVKAGGSNDFPLELKSGG